MKSNNSSTKEPRHTLSLGHYKKQLIIALNAAILLVLVGGTAAYAGLSETVKLTVDGETTTFRTFDDNVGEVLKGRGVELGRYDAVEPAVNSTDIDSIEVRKAEVTTKTITVKLDFETEQRKDDDLTQGTSKVLREGKAGKQQVTYEIITLDGKILDREKVSSKVVQKPTDKVVAIGTQTVSRSSERAPLTGDAPESNGTSGVNWDAIAQCESGGNWSINTGNGYYGGLQFSLSTWQSVGGPGYPHQHSRETQIYYAEILVARAGLGQWGCGHLG